MQITTFEELEELSKYVVLHAMKHEMDEYCLFSLLTKDSILYRVYDDIWIYNKKLASSFALLLENKYEIKIPIK